MRRYETIVISHPSLSQEERQPFFDKLTNLISEGQGLLIKVDEWGQKRLAYEIKKESRGYYVLFEYCGAGDLVKELERIIRLDDRSLKYMTVCISQEVDLDKVKAEIEAAEQKEAETAAAAEAAEAAKAVEAVEAAKAAETAAAEAVEAAEAAKAAETAAAEAAEAAKAEAPAEAVEESTEDNTETTETPDSDTNKEATNGANKTE